MMPSPTKPMRREARGSAACATSGFLSSSAISAASRGLDSQSVAGLQGSRCLCRQLVAVDEVPTPSALLATVGPRRRVPASLGDERVAHLGQHLELSDHAVAAAP